MIKFVRKNCLTIFGLIILGIALFFRLYNLPNNPPSLNWDEISHGYNAFSILKTGKDEWGIKFPLIFRAYGDFKLPLYIYLTTIFEFIGGLNAYTVRAVSVLSGLGLVIVTFLISRKLLKNDKLALIAALLASLSPWGLFLSRVAVEANLCAFLFALGIYFFLLWNDDYKLKNILLTAVLWGLSLHSYNSARIMVPLFSLLVAIFILKKKQFKQLLVFVLILIIFSIPIFIQLFDRSAEARFNLVSLVDQGVINQINDKRSNSKLPPAFSKIIYNRPSFFVFLAGENYLANLSPKFLFFRGGSQYQFSLPDHELLYLVTLPFLLFGLLKFIFSRDFDKKFVGIWFLAAFLPSAITKDAPHVLRTILILPSPMILTAAGLGSIIDFLRRHDSKFRGGLLMTVFILTIFVSFARWWNDYTKIYPKAYSWAWQYGYQEMVNFLKINYLKYDKIYITKRYGEPHEFVLFYLAWNPKKYQTEAKVWDYHANWYWIDGFDKFVFINDWEVISKLKDQSGQLKVTGGKKYLLITSPGNYPDGWNKIKTIKSLDDKTVFEILEKN